MTLPSSGNLSTTGIAEQLYNDSGATISTASADVRRFVKKTSGIAIPDDFYGKGWGQQMNDLSPDGSHNQGNASNMKPNYMDRRCDGSPLVPVPQFMALDSSKSYYGGIYLRNSFNSGPPREIGFNGYYISRNPGFETYLKVQYECIYSGGSFGYTKGSLISFSAGYLSGNRKVIQSKSIKETSNNKVQRGEISISNRGDSGYPHICVNLTNQRESAGTGETYLWDGASY
jgi:hypothetical protein